MPLMNDAVLFFTIAMYSVAEVLALTSRSASSKAPL
jgi:hypothetical protein